jgi:hypothetical protein
LKEREIEKSVEAKTEEKEDRREDRVVDFRMSMVSKVFRIEREEAAVEEGEGDNRERMGCIYPKELI